ncbi:hypothetical protein BDQ12DRAFT_732214 [Crucibulum laeve]|uniref:Nuclear rim protein 1 n=1 Tax=Crucibulum laeve TaxID=68775 RepID=A0A5C3MCU5_9AGAR|nr:hypothetical protein BDQ12DRAFT_732214 [Crucibulum laeve]
MALRRLAQENHAASTSSPSSPLNPALPSTPRNRLSYGAYRSPADTPSISSSVPFDWEAARARRPPPYATPLQKKNRKSMAVGTPEGTPARRAIVRKKGFIEKMRAIPSTIAFEIALFPHNVPLPSPKTSAHMIGGIMHFINLCVRVSRTRKVPDSDLGWEDMYREGEGDSWFDWTVPVTFLLIGASILNAVYLFSRIRLYHLHRQRELVASPHAKFVDAELDFEPLKPPSLGAQLRSGAWYAFSASWRFLLGMNPPKRAASRPTKTAQVQQLQMWAPGDLEIELFSIFSPAHALLWTATGSSNWILMFLIMGLVGIQLNMLIHSYKSLVKDKEILSAEVMHEYNAGFVYPRINPIRHDVAVMTHQSEVVNVWED